MRQITKLAVEAFLNFEYFNMANTRVETSEVFCDTDSRTTLGMKAELYLFDNLIAVNNTKSVSLTLAGFVTKTTMDRLNGVLSLLACNTLRLRFRAYKYSPVLDWVDPDSSLSHTVDIDSKDTLRLYHDKPTHWVLFSGDVESDSPHTI